MKHFSKVAGIAWALLLPIMVCAQDAPSEPATPTPSTTTASEPSKPAFEATPSSPTPLTANTNKDADNLIPNGDFEHGKSSWKATGDIVDFEGHKALEIPLRFSASQVISTHIRLPQDSKVLTITFDVQPGDDAKFKTPKTILRAWFDQGNLITYYDCSESRAKSRKQFTIIYDVMTGTRDLPFQVEITPGEGKIHLSNFVATVTKTHDH